jgi:son of sevenless-like protein
VVISDEEAETALSASESSLRKHEPHTSHAILQDDSISDYDQHWLEAEMDLESMQDGLQELANAIMESPSQPSDFWMPQVTVDGQVGPYHYRGTMISPPQIYYVNTQTGQHSRDLPQEVDDENPEGDLAGLTQSSSRFGTSAGLGMGASAFERSESSQDIGNTTLFRLN